MGFDCGFDIHPALEPTRSNQTTHDLFLTEVLVKYRDDIGGGKLGLGSLLDTEGPNVSFNVGEHPTIPYKCEHFLRFSSKVSGSLTVAAQPYLEEVCKIATKYFGDRVHWWHELKDSGSNEETFGFYGWDEVHAARRRMREQWGESEQRIEGTAGPLTIGKGELAEQERQLSASAPSCGKLYTIRHIPGKGAGMVATSKITRGSRILSEALVFKIVINTADFKATDKTIAREVQKLSKSDQHAFFELHNAYRDLMVVGISPFLGIVRTNAFPLGPELGIFWEASRINHSWRHNSQNKWNETNDLFILYALRDIAEGEEITISHLARS